ncbi:membrane integrity-associated transporter subunit PqiC [Sneathiella sp. CAU 1612]|uniref:Membrane integrity-associated transporter subunit PqiC n=1 Tax=Sneathiella sedimenti TaxID=2816034 RepID=A0ABS3F5D1_9PROT|nr:PqiC family protein [Sneathiella sedimenti]MBO0333691.1 membrane integrity-associated transporter subunit PqiC [Sneathiella sedimenti]
MSLFHLRPLGRYLVILLLIALPVAACGGLPGSAPTNFYILQTTSELKTEGTPVQLADGATVGIGPVQIPGYADRPQIVTFGSGSAINVSDFDHWAEPLSDAIKRVLTSNVANLVGAESVFSYPADFRPDKQSLQVAVNVIDITETGTGVARLSVRWHVKALYDNKVLSRHAKIYETPATPGDYNSYAKALSQLLGKFAQDIAASLNGLNLSS